MEKKKNLSWIFFMVLIFMFGLAVGMVFDVYFVCNHGIPITSFCKEIQIDTLQYDYQQNTYKYEIKLVK